ncbi:hypothetical protein CISIN_1g035602mg, partial [Citrus sinensis]
ARYGVQLEKSTFERRTADFLWMMIFSSYIIAEFFFSSWDFYVLSELLALSAIPMLWTPFLGVSLVFMLLYVWSREFPTAQISIYGLVTLKAFYLPWAMLALDVIFGSPLLPNFLGIIAGHLYYFLTVLHPLAGGRNILATPRWVHKLVAFWRLGHPTNASVQPERGAGGAFTGRSYRLNLSSSRPFFPRSLWSS